MEGNPEVAILTNRDSTTRVGSYGRSFSGRLFLISLSIANLCFLPLWAPVLSLAEDPATRFFEDTPPEIATLFALIVAIVLLAVAIYAVQKVGAGRSRLVKQLSTLSLFISASLAIYQSHSWVNYRLNDLLGSILYRKDSLYYGFLALKVVLLGALLFSLVRMQAKTVRAVQAFFLILAPLFFVYTAHGLWSYAFVDLRWVGTGKPSAPFLAAPNAHRRAVWIVFDELDEHLLFDKRPNRIQTPEFDRLRREALFADRVAPPAGETLLSMPSLLLGKSIQSVKLDTSQLLFLDGGGDSLRSFAEQANIFRKVRAAGFNTGMTGWHLPYCRFVGIDLSDCSWASLGPAAVCVEHLLKLRSFVERVIYMARWNVRLTFPKLVASGFMDATPDDELGRRLQNIKATKLVVQNGIRMLRNPKLDFIVLHVPAPHPPGYWDSERDKFTLANTDYVDNFELADDVLGRIRKTLEGMNAWENSAVLVTSDHPYRPELWIQQGVWNAEMAAVTGSRRYPYVPFFLKLPSQRTPSLYGTEFNNRESGDLLLSILSGHVNTPEQATVWMNQHGS
jgi:Sulfatase